jgi:hypothetical protein
LTGNCSDYEFFLRLAARSDVRQGLRMLVEGNYLLLYEYDPANDTVELVTVVDGRRDLSGL